MPSPSSTHEGWNQRVTERFIAELLAHIHNWQQNGYQGGIHAHLEMDKPGRLSELAKLNNRKIFIGP